MALTRILNLCWCGLLLSASLGKVAADAAEHPDGMLVLSTSSGVVATTKVRLGGATRDAVGSAEEFVAKCPSEAGALVFSIGLAPKEPTGTLSFEVILAAGDDRRILVRDEPRSDVAGWSDHRIEIPNVASQPCKLRFRATPVEGSAPVSGYWGSVRYRPAPEPGVNRPNIILISLDTLGAQYLESFGRDETSSRNIDRFLERSFSFRRAYATYPNTLVSHASLFSGLYPSSHGVYGSVRDARVEVDLLSTFTRRRGYVNVAFTENAFVSSDFGFDQDFDWYDNGPDVGSFLGDAADTFGKAGDWLERFGADGPFMLFVHTYEVHTPYVVRDDSSRVIADRIQPAGEKLEQRQLAADIEHLHNAGFRRLSNDQVKRREAVYIGEIDYLDRTFGKFIDRIERLPFSAQTLIVVFADHGDEFDPQGAIGHGETLNDVVLHVPLAFHWPGLVSPGVYGPPVSLVDVLPTVLDLVDMSENVSFDGRTLAPLVTGESSVLPDRPVFAELQRAAGSCVALRLPERCLVGRFVVHTAGQRFESSMIPHQTSMRNVPGVEPELTSEGFERLLAAYVTGAPWNSEVPWRPRAIAVEKAPAQAIDDVTRERLEALGYDF